MPDDPRTQQLVPLEGSERPPLADAERLGPVPADEAVDLTLVLRPRTPLEQAAAPRAEPLAHAEAEQRFGADPADVDRVRAFAARSGLEVTDVSLARRSVGLRGDAARVQDAFGVELHRYRLGGQTLRARSGAVHVPAELAPAVQAVLGLDERPQARSQLRRLPRSVIVAQGLPATAFAAPEVAALYAFPRQGDGSGQTIALIELGGGYQQGDLDAYFSGLGLATPTVEAVSVDGGANQPGGDADAEVLLDIEVSGAIAPGARIAVYFAPNTDRGFIDALTTAVHDSARSPSVVSISWGGAESSWTAQAIRAFEDALTVAAQLGVTVLAASGDDGSADRVGDGRAHADFPASSPHVLACGGTKLTASGGAIASEVVWDEPSGGASGGGVSDVFDLPTWQQGAGVPPSANPGHRVGRGVPDVAGNADPATGYRVRVDGQAEVVGGTSAVAPLYAGLVALLNQALGRRVGYLNPPLYTTLGGEAVARDVIEGSNGAYNAAPGWDACTGFGSLRGDALLAALQRAGSAS